MGALGKFSKYCQRLVDRVVALFIFLIMAFSVYSLFSTYKLYQGAFVSDKLLAMKPDPIKPELGFAELKAINEDVIAWINVDGTNIDYPVLQGKDNMEYVNKDVYGDFAFSGAIFMDYRNSNDFTDEYSLLYGHHMDKGAMFGDLKKFYDKGFFDSHKTASLITDKGEYKIDLFLLVEADAYDDIIFNPDTTSIDMARDDFVAYLREESINSRDIDFGENDKIIGLSTCKTTNTNGRTILYGVIREEGVSEGK